MTNGNGIAPPSSITGDSFPFPTYGGIPFSVAIPWLMSQPGYTDLPPYWTWRRDVALQNTLEREDMWAAAVARTATKFAARGFTIRDSDDSTRKTSAGQALLKNADGGQGWIIFAEKLIQDVITTDNGCFVRVRRADDTTERVATKAYDLPFGGTEQTFDEVQITRSSPGAKITGLYHLDSLRCMRTGNLLYPIRYQPIFGSPQLLRWDQVLFYADQASPRAELYGVGRCAAGRAYKTISLIAALRQMLYEFVAGKGATKISFLQGISEGTLRNAVKAGELDAQAKGLVYYLGTILGAIPSDQPIQNIEVLLKQLPQGFDPKQLMDDAYLVYANAIGVPVQDIQPLSGQGLGTGKQTEVLQDQSRGVGIAAFLKWWEQTVSDRVLPATTELSFDDEHDLRDQKQRADVKLARAQERAARIQSGEITPAIARQLAADDKDLPQELLAADATPGGQISDDEKPEANDQTSPAALDLMQGLANSAPAAPALPVAKSYDALFAAELQIARHLAKWSEDV